MIKSLDILKAVNSLLKSKYPAIKRHGRDTKEDFVKPCFFVEVTPITVSNESVNFKRYSYLIIITYFQKTINEIDNLTKASEIEDLLGFQIAVKDRKFNIDEYTYDFIGENKDLMQISFSVDFLSDIKKEEKETMKHLYLKTERR